VEAAAVVVADGSGGLAEMDAAAGLKSEEKPDGAGSKDDELGCRVWRRNIVLLAPDVTREVERLNARDWPRLSSHWKLGSSGLARSVFAQAMKPRASGWRVVPSAIGTSTPAL
jgi:hypothetical protein